MPGQYVASRFGQDMPARIATSTSMLLEATALIPNETQVPALIPFYPVEGATGGSSAAAVTKEGHPIWQRYPSRCDLSFYQGDDVVVPLYLHDPANPDLDMSTWDWHSQIRVWHSYRSTLVANFTVDADYLPPELPDQPLGLTRVRLFLPRELNVVAGNFGWELYSVSPYEYSDWPQPIDWPEDEVWPPETTLRTWLYGLCKIVPRLSTTDMLPPGQVEVLPLPTPEGWYPGYPGYFVGPNGRVP